MSLTFSTFIYVDQMKNWAIHHLFSVFVSRENCPAPLFSRTAYLSIVCQLPTRVETEVLNTEEVQARHLRGMCQPLPCLVFPLPTLEEVADLAASVVKRLVAETIIDLFLKLSFQGMEKLL